DDDVGYRTKKIKKTPTNEGAKRYYDLDASVLPKLEAIDAGGFKGSAEPTTDFWPLTRRAIASESETTEDERRVKNRSELEKRLILAERDVGARPESVDAWLARLKAAEALVEQSEVDELWRSALDATRVSDVSGECWLAYARWIAQNFTAFSLPRIEELVARALRATYARVANITAEVARLVDIESGLVALMNALGVAEARAGHPERGLAVLQAALELSVNNTLTPSEWQHRLGDFWESEFARLGDVSHSGMRQWYDSTGGRRITPTEKLPEEPASAQAAVSSFVADLASSSRAAPPRGASVAAAEAAASFQEPPLSSESAAGDDNDGAHGLLDKFDDSLRSLREDGTVYSLKHGYRISIRRTRGDYERVKSSLMTSVDPPDKKHNETPELSDELVESLVTWAKSEKALDSAQWAPVYSRQSPETKLKEPERVVGFDDIRRFVYPLWSTTAKRLLVLRVLEAIGLCCPRASFGEGSDDAVLHPDSMLGMSPFLQESASARAFVRNVLVFATKNPALGSVDASTAHANWAIQLECALLTFNALSLTKGAKEDVVQERNRARALLQTNASLDLWLAYAEFEEYVGNHAESLKLCHATISMSLALPSDQHARLPALYWTCVRMHLQLPVLSANDAARSKALRILACLAESNHSIITQEVNQGGALSPDRVVLCRTNFKLQVLRALSQCEEILASADVLLDDTLPLVPVVACFAWFQLLSKNVFAGLDVFDEGLVSLSNLPATTFLHRAIVDASRSRLERLKKEMVLARSQQHSAWFENAILRPSRARAASRNQTKVEYSRLVHTHPGSKYHWLLAFHQPSLLRSFSASELADILNLLLERGIRIRDPRIVAILE
ncbi:hypothetical protein CTAYLR_003425, partial [Chrysophaeum taylorii]